MQAGGELVFQGLVDLALTLYATLAFEGRRHDLDPKMRFAALAMTGMAAMARRLVFDRQPRRCESRPELVVNRVCYCAHHSPLLPDQSLEHILAECLGGDPSP